MRRKSTRDNTQRVPTSRRSGTVGSILTPKAAIPASQSRKVADEDDFMTSIQVTQAIIRSCWQCVGGQGIIQH